MQYTTTIIIVRFTHITKKDGILNGRYDFDSSEMIDASVGMMEPANAEIKIIKPALPNIIRTEAILRLCLLHGLFQL